MAFLSRSVSSIHKPVSFKDVSFDCRRVARYLASRTQHLLIDPSTPSSSQSPSPTTPTLLFQINRNELEMSVRDMSFLDYGHPINEFSELFIAASKPKRS